MEGGLGDPGVSREPRILPSCLRLATSPTLWHQKIRLPGEMRTVCEGQAETALLFRSAGLVCSGNKQTRQQVEPADEC